jgi:hypothetical protein
MNNYNSHFIKFAAGWLLHQIIGLRVYCLLSPLFFDCCDWFINRDLARVSEPLNSNHDNDGWLLYFPCLRIYFLDFFGGAKLARLSSSIIGGKQILPSIHRWYVRIIPHVVSCFISLKDKQQGTKRQNMLVDLPPAISINRNQQYEQWGGDGQVASGIVCCI